MTMDADPKARPSIDSGEGADLPGRKMCRTSPLLGELRVREQQKCND